MVVAGWGMPVMRVVKYHVLTANRVFHIYNELCSSVQDNLGANREQDAGGKWGVEWKPEAAA